VTYPLILAHQPKTGGLTFQALLRKVYGQRYVGLYYPQPFRSLMEDDYKQLPDYWGYAKAISSHHLQYMDPQDFWPEARFATIIRHPVEKNLSHFFHLNRNEKGDTNEFAFAVQRPEGLRSLEDFFKRYLHKYSSIIFFSRENDWYDERPPCLSSAKEEIEKYHYIGHTDELDCFTEMILSDYPELNNDMEIKNANPDRPQGKQYRGLLEPEVIDMVFGYLEKEIEFYEYALQVYEKRKKEAAAFKKKQRI